MESSRTSPTSARQTLFPSPTYSESTLSSNSQLCTPESVVRNLPGDNARKDGLHASITAANAAFLSATEREDLNAFHINSFDTSPTGGSSLAAALDFGTSSFLGKRNASGSSSTHQRTPSASRRHSIQPLMPAGNDSSMDSTTSHDIAAAFANGFDFSSWNANTDYLLSPPRLTVSLPVQASPTPPAVDSEDSKRRRTSEVSETPAREASANSQYREEQRTPPSVMSHSQSSQMQSSGGSSRVTATPSTCASTSDVSPPDTLESSTSSKGRRFSVAGDKSSDIAGLTAGLTVPRDSSGYPEPPKSAPPHASHDSL